jgi:hypothetical protein
VLPCSDIRTSGHGCYTSQPMLKPTHHWASEQQGRCPSCHMLTEAAAAATDQNQGDDLQEHTRQTPHHGTMHSLLLIDRQILLPHTCKSCSPAAAAEGAQSNASSASLADGSCVLCGGPCCTPQQRQQTLAACHVGTLDCDLSPECRNCVAQDLVDINKQGRERMRGCSCTILPPQRSEAVTQVSRGAHRVYLFKILQSVVSIPDLAHRPDN